MPFMTIEGVVREADGTLTVVNDNNYPFSAGRRPSTPDDNEIVRIEFDSPVRPLPDAFE